MTGTTAGGNTGDWPAEDQPPAPRWTERPTAPWKVLAAGEAYAQVTHFAVHTPAGDTVAILAPAAVMTMLIIVRHAGRRKRGEAVDQAEMMLAVMAVAWLALTVLAPGPVIDLIAQAPYLTIGGWVAAARSHAIAAGHPSATPPAAPAVPEVTALDSSGGWDDDWDESDSDWEDQPAAGGGYAPPGPAYLTPAFAPALGDGDGDREASETAA
jgi:hypothetical protein